MKLEAWTRVATLENAAPQATLELQRSLTGVGTAWPGMRVVDADYKLRQSIKIAMLSGHSVSG